MVTYDSIVWFSIRVMSFVEKSVARLHEPEVLEKLAFDLGRKHYGYKAIPKYFIVRPLSQCLVLIIHHCHPSARAACCSIRELGWRRRPDILISCCCCSVLRMISVMAVLHPGVFKYRPACWVELLACDIGRFSHCRKSPANSTRNVTSSLVFLCKWNGTNCTFCSNKWKRRQCNSGRTRK